MNSLLPRELADSHVMEEHVRLTFRPIVKLLSLDYPSRVLQLSGSLGERLFLPDVVEKKSGANLISADIDILISEPGKRSVVHLESRGLDVGDLYFDPTDCSMGFTRIARLTQNGKEYIKYKPVVNSTTKSGVGSPSIESTSFYLYHCDEVRCFRCSAWPAVACSIYKRKSSWPLAHNLA